MAARDCAVSARSARGPAENQWRITGRIPAHDGSPHHWGRMPRRAVGCHGARETSDGRVFGDVWCTNVEPGERGGIASHTPLCELVEKPSLTVGRMVAFIFDDNLSDGGMVPMVIVGKVVLGKICGTRGPAECFLTHSPQIAGVEVGEG